MAGFDHAPAQQDETESERTAARNSRYGLVLFATYFALYAGFVWLNVFRPDLAESTPVAGVNVAVLYGFALIAAAIVLALVYGWLCRQPVAGDSTREGAA